MISLSSLLQDNLKVTPAENDQVEVTVTLPADLLVDYVRLLDSLTGFFKVVNRKAKYAMVRSEASSQKYAEEAQQRIAEYRSRLVELFDNYSAQGLDRKSAIKQIAALLRSENHPWCCPDLVRSNLVAAGRRGRSGRPRKKP